MDFLYLMIIYCLLFIMGSLCLLYRDAAILCTGPIGVVRQFMNEAVMKLIPTTIQNMLFSLCNHLLYKRTCVFQLCFIALCLLAHVEWVIDMLPILYSKYPNHNHTFWPFVAVFTNYYCFHKAWTGDPGEITNRNCDVYTKVYEYDDILYERGIKCSTCDVIKPARSKHCSVCNRCVHKFDHHCIWTNNCVGALNHRYFILFMVTLITMFLQGIYVGSGCLLDYAEEIRLFNASYIDYDNSVKPITISVAFQHMFMQLPRLMFLVVGLSVLVVLVMVFLCHHLYLIACNQTTNERYKVQALQTHYTRLAYDSDARNHPKDKRGSDLNSKRKGTKGSTTDQKILTQIRANRYAPYSRGLVRNFLEVFLPHRFIDTKLKGR